MGSCTGFAELSCHHRPFTFAADYSALIPWFFSRTLDYELYHSSVLRGATSLNWPRIGGLAGSTIAPTYWYEDFFRIRNVFWNRRITIDGLLGQRF